MLISIYFINQAMHKQLDGKPMVDIYYDKSLLASYPLQQQAIDFIAHGAIGESDIHIEHGHVRILHSSCITQRCVLAGHRHRMGDILACVPNHILVVIRGQHSQAYDAISE